MASCIALLRAVNLGPHNKIAMQDLRELLTKAGMANVRTLLQSGNAVFECDEAPASLEARFEAVTRKTLGLTTSYFVRTAREWAAVIAANPFPDAAKTDPGHLLVLALKDAPSKAAARALQAAVKGREATAVKGRQAYVTFPDGVGASKLTTAVIERTLGTSGTGRNWNTVLKLAALAGS